MGGHTFFFSYARDDFNPFMKTFLDDLAERVRGKAGLATVAESYYRDLTDIEPGQKWEPMLESALQTCKVMLCMYSSRYFQRPVCGMEMQAFLDRQASLPEAERTFLIPVVWIPCEPNIPKTIASITFHHNDYSASHKEKGLEVLTRQASGRYQADYEQCLEAIATRIKNAATRNPPLPVGTFSFGQLGNAFEEQVAAGAPPAAAEPLKGPDVVDFLYIAGTQLELAAKNERKFYGAARGDEWRPFSTPDLKISSIAARLAGSKDFTPNSLRLTRKVVDYLDAAEADNRMLVLLVDPFTLHLVAQYQSQMKDFAKRASLYAAIMVIWNEGDPDVPPVETTLRARLTATFLAQLTRGETFYRPSIKSSGDFESALTDTLIRIQDQIIQIQQASELINESPLRKKPELGNTVSS